MSRIARLLLFLAGWTLLALFFATQTYMGAAYGGLRLSWPQAIAIALTAWYVRALSVPPAFWLARRFPLRARSRAILARNVAVHLAAAVVLAVVEQTLYLMLASRLTWVPRRATFSFELHMNLFTYAAAVAAAHGLDYYNRYRDRELAATRLEAELAGARLDALRTQLQPHFLFNALNGISELMHENVERADEMLNQLSHLLRSSLQHPAQGEAPLSEELQFLERYARVQQMRFADRLTVAFDVAPETLAARVPYLLLQPLLENAIVHGVAPRPQGGHVEVNARREGDWLLLEVRDDGEGSSRGAAEGTGLRNTRLRLFHTYGGEHEFTFTSSREQGTCVRIRIPFRPAAESAAEEPAP